MQGEIQLLTFLIGETNPIGVSEATDELGISRVTITKYRDRLVDRNFLTKKPSGKMVVDSTILRSYLPIYLASK